MVKHTPGPWTVCEHSWSDTSVYAGDVRVCKSSIYDEATEDTQAALEARESANFRLIAASPDLLLELRLLVEAIEGHSAPEGSAADEPYIASRLTFAHDAIDKATKEQP